MENLFDDLFDIMFDYQYQTEECNSLNLQFNKIRNNFKHFIFLLQSSDCDFLKSKFDDMPLIVKLCNFYLDKGIYPIHYIFKNKYITNEMIELVISKGFKLQFDDENKSIVSYLFDLGISDDKLLEILKLLKSKSYDFFKFNNITKFNILHDLTFYQGNDERIYDFVFELNKDIDIDYHDLNIENSYSPLMLSAKLDRANYFKYLIKKNANINQSNDNNNSILMYCCMNSNYELVKLLLEKGVDVNFKDNQNDVALFYACGCEIYKEVNYDLVKLLLDNGATLDNKNTEGHTALHYSCRSTLSYFQFNINYDVIKLLIERGCVTDTIDSNDKTFIDYLIKYSKNFKEIKEIINLINLSNFQKNTLLVKYYDIDNHTTNVEITRFNNITLNNNNESPSDSDYENSDYENSDYQDSDDEYTQVSINLNENSTPNYKEEYTNMIEDLNIIEYENKDSDFKNNTCIICYDDEMSSRGLKCVNSHIFHEKCIYNWIKESKKYYCPLCTNEMILSKIYI